MTAFSASPFAAITHCSARPLVVAYSPSGLAARGHVSSASTIGGPPSNTASVLMWTNRETPDAMAASSAFRVPTTFTR
jgi:hypothetical protein